MINLNFSLRNPWSNCFENLWCRAYGTPFKHKFIELEFYKDSSFLSCSFAWTIRQSHAGLDFELGLLGYCFHFNFYDSRHWEDNKYETIPVTTAGQVEVKFYKKMDDKLIVVRSELCYNIFEAEQLIADEGHQYSHTEFINQV